MNDRQSNQMDRDEQSFKTTATVEMDPLKRVILLALNSASLLTRVSCFLLILATLFARSSSTCKSNNPDDCQSIWSGPAAATVGQVFTVCSCVTALLCVLWALVPTTWETMADWKWEAAWTFITLVFSLVEWPLVANTLPQGYYFSWAFSVSVAGSIAACLSFGLSFRERPPTKGDSQWLKSNDKRIYVLAVTFAFACAFGTMPTLLDVVSKPPQAQAGSYIAVAFFAFQGLSAAFGLNHALPSSIPSARIVFVVCQCTAVSLACISLGLLSNLNVLPMNITSATQFHIQGFLIGGAASALLGLCSFLLDTTGRTRVMLGTREFLCPYPSVLVFASSTILGTSFGSLYIFVEAPMPQPPDASSAILIASEAFLVMGSLIAIIVHLLTVGFLIRPADSRSFVLMTIKRAFLWAVALTFVSESIGFATLVYFDRSVRLSAAMALTCMILCLGAVASFLLFDNSDYLIRRNYTSPVERARYFWYAGSAGPLEESKELKQAKLDLIEEREALDRIKKKLARIQSPYLSAVLKQRENDHRKQDEDDVGARPSTFDLDRS